MSTPKSKVVPVHVVGPLAPYAQDFRGLLADRRYTPLTRVQHLQVMQHLSKWLQARGLGVRDLSASRVEQYLAHRRDHGYVSFCSQDSLAPLLHVLGTVGAPVSEPATGPCSPVEVLLAEYANYLRQQRALAASTTTAYVLRVRRFLDGHGDGVDLSGVDTAAVTAAVLAEAERVSAGSAQFFAVALRCFLRYCYLEGIIDADLAGASLPVTGRRRSVLPQAISTADAQALLDACDQRTDSGRRDYAVILLLMRLGLRSIEVARLELEDLHWRAGQISIRGKHQRIDLLPLPAEVGAAVAAYLRDVRPQTSRREVFLSTIAPLAGLSREAVGWILRRTCKKAGLVPFGPHRLRHSLACELLEAGTGLSEIGQVLRHQDHTTTSNYARVDVGQLRTVARPVPAGGLR